MNVSDSLSSSQNNIVKNTIEKISEITDTQEK